MRDSAIAAISADGIGPEVIAAGLEGLPAHRRFPEEVATELAAARLMRAVERVTEARILTPDLGGTATTRAVTNAVCEALHGDNV
jgi:isocitrate/isopropylmalate dehydrogenase